MEAETEQKVDETIKEQKETGFYRNPKVIIAGIMIVLLVLAIGMTQRTRAENTSNYSVQGSLKYEETDLNSKIPGNIKTVLVASGS
jgi:hypothetical protein